MDDNEPFILIDALNRMLAKEHACAIRYATHAALVGGPYVDPIVQRFQEISSDEVGHARLLRKRICALGGMPTMEVDTGNIRTAFTLSEMIEVNLLEEREAIAEYTDILKNIPRLDVLLYANAHPRTREIVNLASNRDVGVSQDSSGASLQRVDP